jgi:hypothetical protein
VAILGALVVILMFDPTSRLQQRREGELFAVHKNGSNLATLVEPIFWSIVSPRKVAADSGFRIKLKEIPAVGFWFLGFKPDERWAYHVRLLGPF